MSQPDSGEPHQLAIEKLHHHPKNAEFYGETDDITDLVASIEDTGFDDNEPIEIIQEPRNNWPANRIVSGHRRHEAARQAGLDEVPVRTVDFENEDEELNYLLQKNRYRQKTDGMLIREGMWYEKQIRNGDIEAEGRVRDAVGERINMSGRSYQKGREVAKAADEGDEIAQEQWGMLEADEQSIHGAYSNLDDDDSEAGKVSRGDDDDDNDDDNDMGKLSHYFDSDVEHVVMGAVPVSLQPEIEEMKDENGWDNDDLVTHAIINLIEER